jgi:hypothetical protein
MAFDTLTDEENQLLTTQDEQHHAHDTTDDSAGLRIDCVLRVIWR